MNIMALRTEWLLYWTIKQSPERTHQKKKKQHQIPSEHFRSRFSFCAWFFHSLFVLYQKKIVLLAVCACPPTNITSFAHFISGNNTNNNKKPGHKARMKIWIIYEENVMHTNNSQPEIRIPPLYLMSMSMVRISYAPPFRIQSNPCVCAFVFLSRVFSLFLFFRCCDCYYYFGVNHIAQRQNHIFMNLVAVQMERQQQQQNSCIYMPYDSVAQRVSVSRWRLC